MISFKQHGDFEKITKYLNRIKVVSGLTALDKYGRKGVAALAAATPIDSGLTSQSWSYEIIRNKDSVSISFNNDNVNEGVNIAIILQYGHATRNDGWVQGRDYINPAIQPIFDDIANEAWKEITET